MSEYNWIESLDKQISDYCIYKTTGFVSREEFMCECTEKLEKKPFIIIKGCGGEGKSSFISALGVKLRKEYLVINYFVGLSSRAETELDLLRYLCYKLEQECGKEISISEDITGCYKIIEELTEVIYNQQGKDTLLLIDDFDNLFKMSSRSQPPTHLKIAATVRANIDKAEGAFVLDMPALKNDESKEVLLSLATLKGLDLPDSVISVILTKKMSSNCLWLCMVVQQLANAQNEGNSSSWEKIAAEFHDVIEWNVYCVTTGVGEKTNLTLQKASFGLLSVSRYGLTREEIKAIITTGGLDWNDEIFDRILNMLGIYLYVDGDGTIRFMSYCFQDDIHKFFGGGTHELESQLLSYFKSLPFNNPKRYEQIVHHMRVGDDRYGAVKYFAEVYDCAEEGIKEATLSEIVKASKIGYGGWLEDVLAQESIYTDKAGKLVGRALYLNQA